MGENPPLLPIERGSPGRPIEIDIREAINGMLYVAKTGCQWQNFPHEFPHYQSVFYHYRKWCLDGTWERVNRALVYEARRAAGRLPYPSAAIIDSQSMKTTEVGGERGYAAGKKVKGRKRHIVVDTLGHLLKVVVHPANLQDRDGAKLLLIALTSMLRLCLLKIWADGGWLSRLAHRLVLAVCQSYLDHRFAVSCSKVFLGSSQPDAGLLSALSPGWATIAVSVRTMKNVLKAVKA